MLVLAGLGLAVQGATCAKVDPEPGLPEYRALGVVETPGGLVDAVGGNLLVERRDLDIDTENGNLAIEAVWNSSASSWLFNFDIRYQNGVFVDPTGASHAIRGLADGAAIPGTTWVKLGSSTLRTKGGPVRKFDTDGRLKNVRWPNDLDRRLSYTSEVIAGAPRITQIDSCMPIACMLVYSISYDTLGRVTEIADRAAREAHYSYDAAGRLVAAQDALDLANGWPGWRYEYENDALTARTNSEGERVEYRYASGRLSEVTQVGGTSPSWSFTYFGLSRGTFSTTVVAPDGGQRFIHYDEERRVRSITNAEGETKRFSWEGKRPISATEPWGATTTWAYVDDDVVSARYPAGRTVTYTYEPSAIDERHPNRRPVLVTSDDLGVLHTNVYGPDGRLATSSNGEGEATTFTYLSTGELESVTMPDGVVVTLLSYGQHGHPQRVGVGAGFEYPIHDGVGNLLEGTDFSMPDGAGLGGVVSRSFDADRNVAGIVVADLDATSSTSEVSVDSVSSIAMTWRSDHRRTGLERPYGGDTVFRYDALGRRTTRRDKVDGLWRETTFEFGPAGSRTAVTRPNGMRTEWTYDLAGRIVGTTHLRDGVPESSIGFTWVDGLRREQQDSVWGAPESYFYTADGQLSSVRFPGGETLELELDVRSRVVEERYRMADLSLVRELAYTYDGVGRVVEARDGPDLLLAETYLAGAVAQREFGNGLTRAFVHDPATGQLAATTTLHPATGLVEDAIIARDDCFYAGVEAGCLVVETTTTGGAGSVTTTTELFQLSKNLFGVGMSGQRLARWADASVAPTAAAFYSYDELSNLTAVRDQGGTDSFFYNAEHNRLLSVERDGVTLATYTYDEAGFVTARNGEAVTWTAAGRLADIGTTQSFAWDALGRLVERVTEGEAVAFSFGGAVEDDLAGAPQVMDLGFVALSLQGEGVVYRHHDFRGNVKFLTDASGTVVSHYLYSGYALEEIHGADVDRRRFAQGRDLGGLVRLGARVYDPFVGRFLSPDPFEQVFDQHTYTIGNPVHFWDPGGLQQELGWAASSATFGAPVDVRADVPAGLRDVGSTVGLRPGKVICFCTRGPDDLRRGGRSSLGGGGGNGGPSGEVPSCSAAPTRLPHARALLAVMLPLQIALAIAVVRRRRLA